MELANIYYRQLFVVFMVLWININIYKTIVNVEKHGIHGKICIFEVTNLHVELQRRCTYLEKFIFDIAHFLDG